MQTFQLRVKGHEVALTVGRGIRKCILPLSVLGGLLWATFFIGTCDV